MKLFWEIAARLGFWIPCKRYLPGIGWDYVLISKREQRGFRTVPEVGEYSWRHKKWRTTNGDTAYVDYFYKQCVVTHWHKLPRKIKDR